MSYDEPDGPEIFSNCPTQMHGVKDLSRLLGVRDDIFC